MTTTAIRDGARGTAWPLLEFAAWRDTALTLQLWTQIVGKVRLALSPWLNHGWQVPLYVTARGLGTSPIHAAGELFEIEFDLVAHRLVLRRSNGADRGFALEPMTVAAFYRRVLPESSRPSLRLIAEVGGDVEPLLTEVAPAPPDGLHRDAVATGPGGDVVSRLLGRRAIVA